VKQRRIKEKQTQERKSRNSKGQRQGTESMRMYEASRKDRVKERNKERASGLA
jgi:hypothetical protein